MGWTYRRAGVDIDAAARLIDGLKPDIRRTYRPGVVGDVGGFGGLFSLGGLGYRDPLLVSSTDGVGTKLKIAFATNLHDTVGIDLVAMSVNDVAVTGADPLFFLDYFATGRIDQNVAATVIRGVARGCEEAGCALLGGETAELPDLYAEGEYDLAGFCVGAVERENIVDGTRIQPGDALVGLASSGLHSNGFTLARRVIAEAGLDFGDVPEELGAPLGDLLMAPTRIYVRALRRLREEGLLLGAAHLTGGGWIENIPRALPDNLGARIRVGSWPVPSLFGFLQRRGEIAEVEMFRTFNQGVGMICAVPAARADEALATLRREGEAAWVVGQVTPQRGDQDPVHLEEG